MYVHGDLLHHREFQATFRGVGVVRVRMIYLHVQHHDIGDVPFTAYWPSRHHLNDQIAVIAWSSCEICFAVFGHVQ
jgi:hypothetical protein